MVRFPAKAKEFFFLRPSRSASYSKGSGGHIPQGNSGRSVKLAIISIECWDKIIYSLHHTPSLRAKGQIYSNGAWSALILSSQFRLGLPSARPLPWKFPTETVYTILVFRVRATCMHYLSTSVGAQNLQDSCTCNENPRVVLTETPRLFTDVVRNSLFINVTP